jgi:hypothetical protein
MRVLQTRPGQHERGARLLGAADASYERIGVPLPPHDRITYATIVAANRADLGAATIAAAYAAGHALPIELAVEESKVLADETGACHA